ncbi:MAG: hypothetical protein WCT12_14090 [Verrucomicrobiota bacterium]
MKLLDIPKSGRCRDLVFYRIGQGQYACRHVTPTHRHTGATERARGGLGAMSRRWRMLPDVRSKTMPEPKGLGLKHS